MLVPISAGRVPTFTFWALAEEPIPLSIELRGCSRAGSFTPDELLASREVLVGVPADRAGASRKDGRLAAAGLSGGRAPPGPGLMVDPDGEFQEITVDFGVAVDRDRYLMLCFPAHPDVCLALSDDRVTGVLAVAQRGHRAVSKSAIQTPPEGSGIESFPFWLPSRRPGGRNLASRIAPPLEGFGPANLTKGPDRPEDQPNAWVADPADETPWAELSWEQPQAIRRVRVSFDTDFDHPMESVLMHHPERTMPFCVTEARLRDEAGRVVAELRGNHQTHWDVRFDQPVTTSRLRLEVNHPASGCPAAVFRIRVFG